MGLNMWLSFKSSPNLVCVQFVELLKRDYSQYWRNVPYNGTRFAFSGVIGAIIGCILWSIGDRRCAHTCSLQLLRCVLM